MKTHAEAADRIREIAAPLRDKWRAARPDWMTTDSPLKYVDWALEHTIEKSADLSRVLSPRGLTVYELGAGACFLAYTLRECYGARVIAFDQPARPLYDESAAALGVEVIEWMIADGAGTNPLWTLPRFDLLVATQISWMNTWTQAGGVAFVRSLMRHAAPYGRVVLFPNPGAFDRADAGAVFAPLRPVELTLRHLGRGFVFGE